MAGSHSVGKSTLTRYISNKYNLPMIHEVARTLLSEKEIDLNLLRSDIEVTNSFQKEIFFRQIELEKQYTNFVSDRTLDCLAYTAQHSSIVSDLFFSKELTEYIEKLKQNDVIIFFVRPSKATMRQDGVRESLTWDGIVAIDAIVKSLLQIFNLRYFSINSDSMQERVKLVDSVLSLTPINV